MGEHFTLDELVVSWNECLIGICGEISWLALQCVIKREVPVDQQRAFSAVRACTTDGDVLLEVNNNPGLGGCEYIEAIYSILDLSGTSGRYFELGCSAGERRIVCYWIIWYLYRNVINASRIGVKDIVPSIPPCVLLHVWNALLHFEVPFAICS